MDNILRGIIRVEAPGVEQTASRVSAAMSRMWASINNVSPALTEMNAGVLQSVNNIPDLSSGLVDAAASTTEFSSGAAGAASAIGSMNPLVDIAVVGIVALAYSLFNASKGFSETELSALSFKSAIDELEKSVSDLKTGLNFIEQAKDLDFRIAGGTGFAAEVNDLNNAIEKNKRFIEETDEPYKKLQQNADKVNAVFKNLRKEALAAPDIFGNEKLVQLLKTFNDVNKIPESALSDLTDKQKAIVKEVQSNNNELEKLGKERNKASDDIILDGKKIEVKGVENQADQHKKSLKEYQEYLDSLYHLRLLHDNILKFGGIPDSTESNIGTDKGITGAIANSKAIADLARKPITLPIQTDITLDPTKFTKALDTALTGHNSKIKDSLTEMQKFVSSSLTPVFEAFFSSVLSGGDKLKNVFQSLGTVLKQLIAKLAAAAAIASIISLISGGSDQIGFLGAFKQILGFKAGGGPVVGGGAYIVGEKGPEVFTPNTSGMIIPNGRMGGAIAGAGSMTQQLVARVSGADLLFIMQKTQRLQTSA